MAGWAEVRVSDWEDLRRLPLALDEAGGQAVDITAHAVRWVAAREGFEPSPVCLLRPLAEAMEAIRWAFEEAGRAAAAEFADLRHGVEVAARELEASDATARAAVPTVPGAA